MSESNSLQPGQKFGNGRFVLVRFLGRGGMGEVWLAQDERLHEQVALKFLPSEIRGDAVALDDLRRETARSHKLTHPNIVRIHDLHEDPDGMAFIVMEYIDGPTLASLRLEQPNRVFEWGFLRPLVEQLCAALDYAHGEKVIHRDLKPANMMVDGRGRLKLADFGIAAVASDSMSRVSAQHSTSGTLLYMSPQQLAGKRPQATDDIYALGATLYELLTGKPPFYTGDITHQVLHEPPEPMEERLAAAEIQNDVPPDAAALIMACLGKEPGQRPQSALAVAEWIGLEVVCKPSTECLAAALFPQTPSSPAEAVEAEPAGTRASTPAGYGRKLAAVGIVVLVLAGAYWLGKSNRRSRNSNAPLTAKVPAQTAVAPPETAVSLQHSATQPADSIKFSALPPDLRRSLILYYDFNNEPLAGRITDKSGHGNDGLPVNVQWVKDGHRGGAAKFGLNDSYITVPNKDEINPPSLTLAAWIKTSYKDSVWRRIFDKGTTQGYVLSMCGDDKGKSFRGEVDVEPGKTWAHSGIQVTDGQWHHVAGTFDGAYAKVYVDGQPVGRPGHWVGEVPHTPYDLTIGANRSNPDAAVGEVGASFNGMMDDVMMFNRALSADEIHQLVLVTKPAVRLKPKETWIFTTIAGKAGIGGATDGIGEETRFYGLQDIAVGTQGDLYVAEWNNNTIRVVKPSGTVSTLAGLAGTTGTGDGIGPKARFRHPRGIAVDRSGNVFVTEFDNHSIRKITPSGIVTTFAGKAGIGGSTDGPAAIARFNHPNGIAIGPDGNMFVTDGGGNTIRKITPDGVVSTLAGHAGVTGSMDGMGLSALFEMPHGIAVGARGLVYVTDNRNNTVRIINPSGAVSTFAGQPGVAGSTDGVTTNAQFDNPRGIAVDIEDNVYVADFGNHIIRKITSAGLVTTIAGLAGQSGNADGAGTEARFNHPFDVALDGEGNIYVTDAYNNTIRKGQRQQPQP
jgi:serine/threonine protein kinase/sugar lactone lactonase YvrE